MCCYIAFLVRTNKVEIFLIRANASILKFVRQGCTTIMVVQYILLGCCAVICVRKLKKEICTAFGILNYAVFVTWILRLIKELERSKVQNILLPFCPPISLDKLLRTRRVVLSQLVMSVGCMMSSIPHHKSSPI